MVASTVSRITNGLRAGGKQPVNPSVLFLGGNFVWTVLIESFLGFLFTQTGFRCAKPLKKGFDTDRRQFVNLPGNACALGRLFVVHPNRKSLQRPQHRTDHSSVPRRMNSATLK